MSNAEQMIDIDVRAEKLLRKFDRLPSQVQQGVMRGLRRELLLCEEAVRQGSELKFSGARSGLLSRLTSSVRRGRNALGVEAVIGFRKTRGFPYELSQEFGARAKPGGAMAIPISDEAKAASAQGRGPRELGQELFVLKTADRAMLMESMGGARLVAHYVLVKSIRPRLHFRRSVLAQRERILSGMVAEARRATA